MSTPDTDTDTRATSSTDHHTEIATTAVDPPDVLRDRDQWICWAIANRDGNQTKVPTAVGGGPASATDPDTWADYASARNAVDTRDDLDGVGFVFGTDDVFAGIDLDDVRDPETGLTEPWAADILDQLDSFTEVSYSGTGLHVYVVAIHPDHGEARNKRGAERTLDALADSDALDTPDVEMYDRDRFFAYTGDHVGGTPRAVEQRSDAYRAIHDEHLAGDDDEDTRVDVEIDPPDDDDGGEFENDVGMSLAYIRDVDPKLDDLLSRAVPTEHGYPSASEADLAAAAKLWFWQFTEQQIASVIRCHRRRPKVLARDDYLETTIGRVATPGADRFEATPRCPDCGWALGEHTTVKFDETHRECSRCRIVWGPDDYYVTTAADSPDETTAETENDND